MVSKFLTALAVAGVASAAGTNIAKFNAYWGQSGPATEKLRDRCDEGADYISLSFVTSSPENNPSGWPGIGFAAHCWATAYDNNGVPSQLLNHCGTIQEDLQYCRDKGIKMLLSIGGVWDKQKSDYRVTTEKNGREFADFLWGAFGPYDASWKGPRPFDGPSGHSAVDGFDFDLELGSFDNKPWIAMADQFRSLSNDIIITGAPQCPTSPAWFHMKEMIQKVQFDALFVQFYNNIGCDLIIGNDPGNPNDDFNYNEWESIIASSDKSRNAKLFVGIPASPDPQSATDGYVSPKNLEHIICKIAKRPSFGGISIWDMWSGKTNIIDGKSFNEHVKDILTKCGGQTTTTTSTSTATTTTSTTTTTTTTSITTTTTTTSSSSSTSSAVPTSQSSSVSVPIGTGIPTSVSSSSVSVPTGTGIPTSVSSSSVSVPIGTGIPTSVSSSSVSVPIGTGSGIPTSVSSSSVSVPIGTGSGIPTTGPVTTAPPVTSAPWSNSTTTQEMTTSTVYTTVTRTITSCAPTVTNCPARVVTETIPLYTTVCPVTKTNQPPKPTAAPSQPAEQMTTSTVYTTVTRTITSCAPSVTNCPARVVTETIPLYTTVCPVTQTNQPPKPTASPSQPTEEMTTSTIYTTTTYTISKCPPSVPNCPIGQKTTETVSVSTTVCPVTKTNQVPQPTQPAGKPPGGQKPSGQQPSGVAKPTETTLTVVPVKPTGTGTGSKCPGGPNCPVPTGDHNKCPGGVNCPVPVGSGSPPAGTSAPAAATVKPITPTTGGASSVAAGLVALVAAQIFLL
ncbi:hypothetical protein V2A60_002189 [Cordyceps javanica]